MTERFEADFSRQYRLAVNAAPYVGFAATAILSYVAGLGPVWGGVWTLAVTLALLALRWTMIDVGYELRHDGLTIARGPWRSHVRWDEIERVRRGAHHQHGVGGYVVERRGGGAVAVAPRHGARFIRVLAERAPAVRFAWEPARPTRAAEVARLPRRTRRRE